MRARDLAGNDGLDVPWRKSDEAEWERLLTQDGPAVLRLNLRLLQELGGVDHVQRYGWRVTLYPDHAELVKTPMTEFESRCRELLDVCTETVARVLVPVIVGLVGL